MRRLWANTEVAGYIREELGFPGAQEAAMVEKVRVAIATGEASKERWYLLTSLPPHRCSPGEMLRLFRSHWSIEKNLHHVKDRSWDEDRHTLRRPGLGEVFATMVNVSLNTLRLACVWKDGFLPECPCRCEPRPVPSARNRLSHASSDMRPDFAIVLPTIMPGLDQILSVLNHQIELDCRFRR